ncbi:hypothetical protein XENOCAPTIV_024709, partial [Xenoophorus captivus]
FFPHSQAVYCCFFGQLTCTPCWTLQRLQTASCLSWTQLKVGTIMEIIVSPASLLRASPAMVTLVCQGFSDITVKKRVDFRKALSKITEVRFPDTRLFPLDSDQDATLLLRHLGSQRQRKLGFRSRRSHLLAQHVTFTANSPAEGTGGGLTDLGTLCVSGYVRGRALHADRLVHISGHGDFQLSQIDAPPDPLPLNLTRPTKPGKGRDAEMQVGVLLIELIR